MRPGRLDAVGLISRLLLAGVLLVAGWLKVTDLTGSVQSVVAYDLCSCMRCRSSSGDPGLALAGGWLAARPHTLAFLDTLPRGGSTP